MSPKADALVPEPDESFDNIDAAAMKKLYYVRTSVASVLRDD